MKVQCELCREIVVAGLAVQGGGAVEVHCPACDGRFTVEAAAATPAPPRTRAPSSPPPIGAPAMTCPKCGCRQRPADACRACGLLAARMDDFSEADRESAPAEVAAAWDACERAWTDHAAHEELARAAAMHDAYAWAARRYQARLRATPDDAIAAARVAAITRITEASLRAGAVVRKPRGLGAPPPSTPMPYRSAITMLVALVLLALMGTVYAIATTSKDDAHDPPIPVKPVPRSAPR